MIWLSLEFGRAVWPEHVEDKGMFVFYWEIIIHTVALGLSFLLYLPGYLNWTTAYQKYQINKASKWPWQRDNWSGMCKKMLLNVFFNDFVFYPIVVYLATSRGIKQRFNEFPTFWELFGQLVVVYYLEDFFFYWGHRTFHETPVLYKFHKVHHEFDKIFTVVTEYIHPVDLILGNVVLLYLFSFPQHWPCSSLGRVPTALLTSSG